MSVSNSLVTFLCRELLASLKNVRECFGEEVSARDLGDRWNLVV